MDESLDNFVEDALRKFDEPLPSIAESAGDRIGNYTLVEELGSGGFGVVWRAEQSQPVKRVVALKIIKAGMDTREVVSRFKAERQALAVLDHPSIAKVFDAGATPKGRPFFVMELVEGASLTAYCTEHALSLNERLALFVDVCRAMQHAHQKGILHRDLKPSNVLVSVVDGRPVPKVIDFGIAKATSHDGLLENTLVTRADRLMGTPAYMSPEQSLPGMDVDTRTDIYSLGVVLYELLTGQLPFEIGADGRVKRDRDTQRPSTRIKSLTAEQLQKLGETQRVAGPKLASLIRGDLDWIVMKALELDRARRYDSADALAEDVQAYLDRKPVSARPPTTWYLLTRFTQRNKLAVSAAVVVLLTLIAGVATSTWMYFKEKEALVRSQQVSKFMTQILDQAGPMKALGRDHTMLREIMDRTAERIGAELADQPLVQIELRHTLAETYYNLEEFALAVAQADEVLLLRKLHAAEDLPGMARSMGMRALILGTWGKDTQAIEAFRAAIALHRQVNPPDQEAIVRLQGNLAWPLMNVGQKDEAEKLARDATEYFRTSSNPLRMIQGPDTLVMILNRTKRGDEAVKISDEMIDVLKKKFGPEHPQIMHILGNVGYVLCSLKCYDEAEPRLLEAVRQGEKFFPLHNPSSTHIYGSLLRLCAERKDWAKQLKYARQQLATAKRPHQPDARDVRAAASQLAGVLLTNAERCLEEAHRRSSTHAAQEAASYFDELRSNQDFAPEVKSNAAWLDCLSGYQLLLNPSKRDEAKALITRGLEELKKIKKPASEDTRRVKKAVGWATTN